MSEIAEAVTVPPEVLDRHWSGGDSDTGSVAISEPDPDELDEDSPDDDLEDTLDEDPDDDADTEDDEELEGDDPVEDGDEESEEDDSDEEEEETEDVLESDRISKEERERIEADPALKKIHRQMQAAFTRKTQELATSRREVEQAQAEYEQFAATLQTDEGAEEFLIRLAVARPDLIERVYERSVEINDDDDAKQTFLREQDLKAREQEVERLRRQRETDLRMVRAQEITADTRRIARAAKLTDPEDIELVERAVATKIRENRTQDPNAYISEAEIKAEVEDIARTIRAKEERVRKAEQAKRLVSQKERVKEQARNSRRTPPARATSSPGARVRKSSAPPEGMDVTEWRVKELLGG